MSSEVRIMSTTYIFPRIGPDRPCKPSKVKTAPALAKDYKVGDVISQPGVAEWYRIVRVEEPDQVWAVREED